jgi:hypothetical protein
MHVFLQIAKRRLALLGGFAVGLGLVALFAPPAVLEFDRADLPADSASSSRADRLIEQHECWSGEAPSDMAGRVPGHVVVTTSAGRAVYSARLVGPALDQTFNGRDAALLVHAFCR